MNLQKSLDYFKYVTSIKGIALISPKHKIVHHNIPLADAELNLVLKQIQTVVKNYPKEQRAKASMSLTVGTKNVFYHPVPSGAYLFLLDNENEIDAIRDKCVRIVDRTYAAPPKFKKEPLVQQPPRQTPMTTLGLPPQHKPATAPVLDTSVASPAVASAQPAASPQAAKPSPVLTASGRLVVSAPKTTETVDSAGNQAMVAQPSQPEAVQSHAPVPQQKAPAAMTQEAMQPIKPVMTPVLKRAAMAPTTKIQVMSTSEDEKSRVIHTEVYADNKKTLILGLEDGFDIVSAHNTDDGRVLIQLKKTLSS